MSAPPPGSAAALSTAARKRARAKGSRRWPSRASASRTSASSSSRPRTSGRTGARSARLRSRMPRYSAWESSPRRNRSFGLGTPGCPRSGASAASASATRRRWSARTPLRTDRARATRAGSATRSRRLAARAASAAAPDTAGGTTRAAARDAASSGRRGSRRSASRSARRRSTASGNGSPGGRAAPASRAARTASRTALKFAQSDSCPWFVSRQNGQRLWTNATRRCMPPPAASRKSRGAPQRGQGAWTAWSSHTR